MNTYQDIDFEKLSLPQLIDYIVVKHHQYAKQLLLLIGNHLDELLINNDKCQDVIQPLYNAFEQLRMYLDSHFHKEENILFPFFKKFNYPNDLSKEGSLIINLSENPIKLMQSEHEQINRLFGEIRKTTNNFELIPSCSQELKLCYAELSELEHELKMHTYMENKVLFPVVRKAQ